MADRLTLDQLVDALRNLDPTDPARLAELAGLILPAAPPDNPAELADDPGGLSAAARGWRSVLRDIPFDGRSFDDRFQLGRWRTMLEELEVWWLALSGHPGLRARRHRRTYGFLGLLLLTLVGLEESSHRRTWAGRDGDPDPLTGTGGPQRPSHDCTRVCHRLVREPAVREAIDLVYRPDADGDRTAGADRSARAWREEINLDTLEFHAHGTTSVILRGRTPEVAGRLRPLALKLIIYPYLRIPRIESATRVYKRRYDLALARSVGQPGQPADHLVSVWASSSGWILMDLVEGVPLDQFWADRMRQRRAARTGWWRMVTGRRIASERGGMLADLRTYGGALFGALAELDRFLNPDPGGRAGGTDRREHCDLTPSNIIVSHRDGRPVFHLIDMGVNYFYTYAFAGYEGADSRFVAPEIKRDGRATGRADRYSLGKLLIMFSGGEVDDVVPDALYAHAPLLARFIEDLIDHDPRRRGLVFPVAPQQRPYERLYAAFTAELDAEAARAAPTDNHWLYATWSLVQTRLTFDLFRPLAGVPGQLRRVYQARRREAAVPGRSAWHAAALLGWSWLSTLAWAVTFSVLLIWFVRQTGWEWGNRAVEALQKALGGSKDHFPLLDSLRAPDYVLPDLRENLPSLLVGLSYAMVGAKYYQNLFAQVTPMLAGWRAGWLTVWAAIAQFFMRLETIVAASLVLPVVLVDPDWWPICSAIGQTLVFLCNGSSVVFARRALRDARRRGLTTVPASDSKVTGMTSFAEWAPVVAVLRGCGVDDRAAHLLRRTGGRVRLRPVRGGHQHPAVLRHQVRGGSGGGARRAHPGRTGGGAAAVRRRCAGGTGG